MLKLNLDSMEEFIEGFNVLEHKFFYECGGEKTEALERKMIRYFYNDSPMDKWEIGDAIDAYRTIDKVYGIADKEDEKYCNIVQRVTEEFLGSYVDIDGIQELFRSSYFDFEWMMHLEYDAKSHGYTYYRDHYMHQIRNMYEMFVLLDDLELWRKCMEIYQNRDNVTAYKIKESITCQLREISGEEKRLISEIARERLLQKGKKSTLTDIETEKEELVFHYIIFATAIVSSLAHDIGYPITFMKRTMGRLTEFLPLSNMFFHVENEIPRINSLLKGSLLFQVVDREEIEERLKRNDHGALSAIILLVQYYDNGQIFGLQPMKRMVIELSAVVIYNHTLKYRFQDTKKRERYNNIFTENPISFLFRLCDDLQEWERVYFDISKKSNFFVCSGCKMPMIKRNRDLGDMHYKCFCTKEGINSNLFSYRRLINVAPFNYLDMKRMGEKKNEWELILFCDLGNLLQVCNYNPVFAVKRAEGLHEIKQMVKQQAELPKIYIKTFISNNPVAIKVRILQQYLEEMKKEKADAACEIKWNEVRYFEELIFPKAGKERFEETEIKEIEIKVTEIREDIVKLKAVDKIWKSVRPKLQLGSNRKNGTAIVQIFKESIEFYLNLLLIGKNLLAIRKTIYSKPPEREDKLSEELFAYCEKIAFIIADQWNIYDNSLKALIADYLVQELCHVNSEEFFGGEYIPLYEYRFTTRVDSVDTVKAYLDNGMYEQICENHSRKGNGKQFLLDFYSDYYLYFNMNRHCGEPKS